ncbi:MAG: hypothetical protein Q7R30_19035, partial [Acidobacteriota bacterium]|nr:hypothetical protein [Acidobacteriota bacterium]
MKRFIAILAVFLAIAPPLAAAQTLADVAKAEELRRKSVKKPAKTYGNGDLKPDTRTTVSGAATPATPADTAATPTPGAAAVNIALSPDPGAAAAKPAAQDEAFWKDKIATARALLDRTRLFADALQSRINALNTDFVNRDDPAQRSVIEQDRVKALAELERVKKEMTDQTKAIADIQEEARKAGVPAAWVR